MCTQLRNYNIQTVRYFFINLKIPHRVTLDPLVRLKTVKKKIQKQSKRYKKTVITVKKTSKTI